MTDRELQDIEAQIDDSLPPYVLRLVRELREAHRLLRVLTEAVTR